MPGSAEPRPLRFCRMRPGDQPSVWHSSKPIPVNDAPAAKPPWSATFMPLLVSVTADDRMLDTVGDVVLQDLLLDLRRGRHGPPRSG